MKPAPIPQDDESRLQALAGLRILDTPPEERFDRITRIASAAFGVPIALVSLIDRDRQWFKSCVGLDVSQTPRDVSFCGHAILSRESLVVADTLLDPRFADNPLVIGEPRIRFYAGHPLRTPDGHLLGTLCIIDRVPRTLAPGQLALLHDLAAWAESEIHSVSLNDSIQRLWQLERFFNLSLDYLCIADTKGYFKRLSPSWESLLGYSLEELRSRPYAEFILPEDRGKTAQEAKSLAGGGTTLHFENRYMARDGGLRWMQWTAVRVPREGLIFAVARDVTNQRLMEVNLRESEERYRDLFENASDLIQAVGPDGRFQYVNRAWSTTLGYPAEEVPKLSLFDVIHPDSKAHCVRMWEAVLRGEDPGFVEAVFVTRAGRAIAMEGHISVRREDGKLVSTRGIFRDVSERHALDRMKSEFISTVSHELRTPLTSILGTLGLLSAGVAGPVSEKAAAMIRIAHENSERLVRLINELLDMDRLSSGMLEMSLAPLDLSGLVEKAVMAGRGLADKHRVAVLMTKRVDGLRVLADPDRLMQVLANLISNAIKFSPADGSVEVEVTRIEGGARVSVIDHGPGLSPEFRTRIFQRFAQADPSDKRARSGSGLGLNIAKSIMDRLGGRIGFESVPGQGATFWIELPEIQDAAVSPARGDAPSILICEDDPDVAALIAMLVREAGYTSEVARSLGDAERLLSSGRFDALTLDLVLPDGNGLALVKRIREEARFRDLPVVVVSARAGAGSGEVHGTAVGVLEWLSKPIDRGRLVNAVNHAYRSSPGHKAQILHVEDDADNRHIIASLLQDVSSVEGVATLGAARKKLAENSYDLVILDLALPDGDGLQLLAEVKGTPVIIFSARELPAGEISKVLSSFVKTRVSNEQLRNLLLAHLGPRPPRTAPRTA